MQSSTCRSLGGQSEAWQCNTSDPKRRAVDFWQALLLMAHSSTGGHALAAAVRPSSAAHQYPKAALSAAGSHAGQRAEGGTGRSPWLPALRYCSSALSSNGPGNAQRLGSDR